MANTGGNVVATADLLIQAKIDNAQVTRQASAAAKQFDRAFQQTQKQFKSQDTAQQVAAVNALSAAFSGLAKNLPVQQLSTFQKITAQTSSVVNRFGGVLTGAAIGVGILSVAVVKLGANFAQTAGDFQALESSINAIIANSETANTTTEAFIGGLRDLALQSGRSSAQLANTGRQFLALEFSGARTTEVLTAFTKAAALTGATNEQLRLALNGVSQIASKGSVSMEELRRQIAENLPGAVNLSRFFEILGVNMGITTEEARKLQEQGKITADVGIQALIETVNEATEGIDVFALRAKTLSGVMGIITEGFTQAVQTGFRPFIDIVLEANSGPLGQFLESIRGTGTGISGLNGLIERFATTLGTSFRDILNEVLPLIPQFANLFVTLTEAFAPVIVDIVRMGASIASVLLPALNVLATGFRFLLTELGPVSFILRQLVVGGLINGLVRAFSLFGRAVGSIGGLIGRIATPVANATKGLSGMANIISAIVTGFGFLRPIIEPIARLFGGLVGTVGAAIIAFKLFHVQQRIVAGFTAFNTAFGLRSAALQSFATNVGLVVTRLRAAIVSMGLFRAAALATGIGALVVLVGALASASERAKQKTDELIASLTADVDLSTVNGITEAINRAEVELDKLDQKSQGVFAKIKNGFLFAFAPQLQDKSKGPLQDTLDGLEEQSLQLRALFSAVEDQTGAAASKIRAVAAELNISLTNLTQEQQVSNIKRIVDTILTAPSAVKSVSVSVDELNDKFKGLFSAAEGLKAAQASLKSAQEGLAAANKDLATAVADVSALEAERLVILADTTSEINELAEAEDNLLRINNRLRDIAEDRIELEAELAELLNPAAATADELSEADRNLERAKIALAKAQRTEIELNKVLTKEQKRSLNLQGLSLDELRNVLANSRASLDAERSLNDEREDGTKTQAEIDEDRALARLDVLDAEQTIRNLEAEKLELTNKQLTNAVAIREKEQQIANLAIDKRDAIRDQNAAQASLNALRAGETTQAAAVKVIDDQIKTARDGIATATERQRDAANQVTAATLAAKQASIEQAIEVAKVNGNLSEQHRLELQLFNLRGQSLGVTRLIGDELQFQINTLNDMVNRPFSFNINGQVVMDAVNPGATGSAADQAIQALARAMLLSPEFRRNIPNLAKAGGNALPDFAMGGLITHPMIANIGEGFKHELMLPLTKPDRVWSLLSQHLPKYPGALGAAQAALGTPDISARALRVGPTSGGNAATGNHWERDVLTELRLMRETISNMEPSGDLKVEVRQSNEAELLRKIRREIEKSQAKRRR